MKIKFVSAIKNLRVSPFLVDIFRFIADPKGYLSVWKDYRKTLKDCVFLRERKIAVDKNRTVLIAPASGMVYEAKTFAMLSTGLREEGFRVVVLLSRYYTWMKRYFKAYGIDKFVFWEDIKLSKKEREESVAHSADFHSVNIDFQSVKKWKYHGANIGPQIISSVSRYVMQGAPDVKDPVIQGHLFDLLPETLSTVHRAERIIEKINPQIMVVIEANYAIMGALVDTAISRGVKVIQTVQPSRDDAMVSKRLTEQTRRYHPNSVSLKTLHFFDSFPWTQAQEDLLSTEFKNRYGGKWFLQSRNQPHVKQKNKGEIIKELGLDPDKKTAIVFSHILWDANLFYGDDLFEDYGDWFVQTVRAACRNPNVNWLIKLHPANLWKRARENVTTEFSEVTLIKKEIGELPEHVKLLYPDTDISTWSLFELADYGVTVRGTIGMEMTCLGVPVFTAGTGRYSGLGFTDDSNSKEEYLKKLAHIQEFHRMSDEQTLLAKKHAFVAFRLRPWVMKSFKAVFNYKKKGSHPLDHNLLFDTKSWDEIDHNNDLKKWAKWAARGEIDYLDPDEIAAWKKS